MLRFDCACGRALKAPEKMAGATAHCPGCGADVAVPELEFSASTPRKSKRRSKKEGSSVWVPATTDEESERLPPQLPGPRKIEPWTDPLLGLKFVFRLSGLFTFLTVIGVGLYPYVLTYGITWVNGLFLSAVWLAAMAGLFGRGFNYLDSIMDHATSGGHKLMVVPAYDLSPVLTSFARWGLCFASGPGFLVYFAFRYWMQCGDMTLVDYAILAELAIPAISYWLLGLLVLNRRPELTRPSPQQVWNAFQRLGPRAIAVGVGATAVIMLHICLAALAVTLLHSAWLAAVFLIWVGWFSIWQCAGFALGTLGFWYYRNRKAGTQQSSCPVTA